MAMFTATDERDWDTVATAFGEQVRLDYTSLAGGEPAELSGRQIADAWAGTIGSLEATHRLTGNYLIAIDAEHATARFAATATHRLAQTQGDSLWTLGARYHAELHRHNGRWLITALTMTAVWGQGNQVILDHASAGQA